MVPTITKFPFAEALPLHAEVLLLHLKALLLPFRDKIGIFYFFLRSVGAQASKLGARRLLRKLVQGVPGVPGTFELLNS